MKSLYAQYLEERTNDHVFEIDGGFATYRYLNQLQVYIIDIFVLPENRKKGLASDIADTICAEAKLKGCIELLGTVNPSCKNATESMQVLLAYGMKLESSSENLIIFKKGI